MSAGKALVRSLPPRLRTQLSMKLGQCPRCMRSSIFGTIVGWMAVGLVTTVWPNPTLLIAALVVAGSVTLLLVTHLAVFLVRVATGLRKPAADRSPAGESRVLGRREFFTTLTKVGIAAFAAALFGSVVRGTPTASAQVSGPLREAFECIEACFEACEELFPDGEAEQVVRCGKICSEGCKDIFRRRRR